LWSQHNAILGRFLKTSFMPYADGFLLLALGAIPLLVLELVKVVRHARHRSRVTPHSQKPAVAQYDPTDRG
jgi:P-type Ca2+ transporter type 2C